MNLTDGLLYSAIFGEEMDLTATDLQFRGMYNASSGIFPTPVAQGYYWGITTGGTLPAPVGTVVTGDWIFYSVANGWGKGAVVKMGVTTVNTKSGIVTLNTDDLSDSGRTNKWFSQVEKDKLALIESGAEVNDTASEIKTKYESNADTNAFTDAFKTKLTNLPTNADENVVEIVKLNGVALPVDGSKAVNIVIGAVFNLKGSVATYSALPSTGMVNGDTYQVIDTGLSYYWLDTDWESMGGTVDLSNYYTKTEVYSKTEIDTSLSNKVDKIVGKGLSTNDYTTAEKTKLTGIEDGAQVNNNKVMVSTTDTISGTLDTKIVAGANVVITKMNTGANEYLEIASTGGGGSGSVDSVNGVLPVLGNVTLTKTDIGLPLVDNVKQIPLTYLDTDITLVANSNLRVATQKATKAYVDGLSSINAHGVVAIPTLTNNGDGSITIGNDGIFNFYKDADGLNGIVKLSVTSGATLTLADNAVNFIYCDYNNGVPTYITSIDQTIFYPNADYTPVYRITRTGTTLKVNNYSNYGLVQSGKHLFKDTVLNGFGRQSGMLLSTSGTRVAEVTAGIVWFGIGMVNLPQAISGTTGTMYEYYKVSNVWTLSTALTSFDALYYNGATDRLTMTDSYYSCKYFYKNVGSENEIYFFSGGQYSSKGEAIAEERPTPPSLMAEHSIYLGKIVIQKNATTGSVYRRTWGDTQINANISSHSDLKGVVSATTGIKDGHIDDQPQTIYGKKTFNDNLVAPDLEITGITGSNIITSINNKTILQNIDNAYTVGNYATGFTTIENVIINYDSTARTITLTGSFKAYFRGKEVTTLISGWVSSAHGTGNGNYYLYYDGTSFAWSTSEPSANMLSIAYIYYGATDKFAIRKCNGFMIPEVRRDLHKNMGMFVNSGGTVSNYTLNSTINTERRPYVALTQVIDEDIVTNIPLHNSQLYTKMYLTSTGTSNFDVETAEIVPVNANQPYYNQYTAGAWQQTLMPSNTYQALWLLAIPTTSSTESQKYRYIWVQGQSVSNGLSTVAGQTTSSINLGTLPNITNDYIFLARVIINYNGTTWNIAQVDYMKGNRFTQTILTSGSGMSGVNVDSSISGTGTVESPLSITSTTVSFTNKTIDGGSY